MQANSSTSKKSLTPAIKAVILLSVFFLIFVLAGTFLLIDSYNPKAKVIGAAKLLQKPVSAASIKVPTSPNAGSFTLFQTEVDTYVASTLSNEQDFITATSKVNQSQAMLTQFSSAYDSSKADMTSYQNEQISSLYGSATAAMRTAVLAATEQVSSVDIPLLYSELVLFKSDYLSGQIKLFLTESLPGQVQNSSNADRQTVMDTAATMQSLYENETIDEGKIQAIYTSLAVPNLTKADITNIFSSIANEQSDLVSKEEAFDTDLDALHG